MPQPLDIGAERCQWELGSGDFVIVGLQPLDDAAPAGAVSPRSVDKDNAGKTRHAHIVDRAVAARIARARHSLVQHQSDDQARSGAWLPMRVSSRRMTRIRRLQLLLRGRDQNRAELVLEGGGATARTTPIAGEPSVPPRAAETRLRGRDRELRAIEVHLDRLRCGLGTVAVFEGPAGIGKTRLLAEVLSRGERLQMATGLGAADPSESVVHLAPLLRALFEGGPAPILDRRSLAEAHRSPEERYWLLQDVESLLERAAQRAPVVVCLDDLQWADVATAAALRTLPDRLAAIPVGWFLGTRLGPRAPPP